MQPKQWLWKTLKQNGQHQINAQKIAHIQFDIRIQKMQNKIQMWNCEKQYSIRIINGMHNIRIHRMRFIEFPTCIENPITWTNIWSNVSRPTCYFYLNYFLYKMRSWPKISQIMKIPWKILKQNILFSIINSKYKTRRSSIAWAFHEPNVYDVKIQTQLRFKFEWKTTVNIIFNQIKWNEMEWSSQWHFKVNVLQCSIHQNER